MSFTGIMPQEAKKIIDEPEEQFMLYGKEMIFIRICAYGL